MECNTEKEFSYISGEGVSLDELMKDPNPFNPSSSQNGPPDSRYEDEEINDMPLREIRKTFKNDPTIYSDFMKRRRRVQKRYNTACHRLKEKRSQLEKEREDLIREIVMYSSMSATPFTNDQLGWRQYNGRQQTSWPLFNNI